MSRQQLGKKGPIRRSVQFWFFRKTRIFWSARSFVVKGDLPLDVGQDETQQLVVVSLVEMVAGHREGRFGLLASDRTTDEIRATLRRDATPIRPLDARDVIALLEEADLIKFARLTPEPEEAEKHLEEVRDMVTRSKPLPVAAPDSEGGGDGDGDGKADDAAARKEAAA